MSNTTLSEAVIIPKVIITDSRRSTFVFSRYGYPYILLGYEDDKIEDDVVELMIETMKVYGCRGKTKRQHIIKENGYIIFRRGFNEFARVKIQQP